MVLQQMATAMAMNRDRILIAAQYTGAAFNIGWALAFPDNYFAWLNWLAGGFCLGVAVMLPIGNKMRKMIEEMTVTMVAQSAAIDAATPAHMRTMLQGALLQVVEQMRKDGTLPPELNVVLTALMNSDDGNKPKIIH